MQNPAKRQRLCHWINSAGKKPSAMAEIINLNRARKTKKRNEKRKTADQNARKFGRTKGEKNRDDWIDAKAKDTVDQHKLEP